MWAARPGFVNFALSPSWLAKQVDTIRQAGPTYGNADVGARASESRWSSSASIRRDRFTLATRGVLSFGSALANILEAAGYDVEREYYFNDAGSQMDRFNQSLYARYLQEFGREAQLPADGYQGDYMVDLAREIKRETRATGSCRCQEQDGHQ